MNKLTVFFGAQWGSEGKGNFASAIANENKENFSDIKSIRVGSVNSGHTLTTAEGESYCTQLVPCATFVDPNIDCILGAASLIEYNDLYKEIKYISDMCKRLAIPEPTYWIDEQAGVVNEKHRQIEEENRLEERIGSTKEGVGASTAERVMRDAPVSKDYFHSEFKERAPQKFAFLKDRLEFVDTVRLIHDMSQHNSHLIVEGTQGILLSLYTSGYYPFCTSRQCDPMSLMGQCGTSYNAWDETDIIAVCRTYPTRVGGNSGDLPKEVSWDYMKQITDGYIQKPETTSVTGRNRRIAELDYDILVNRSFAMSGPTCAAISFMDYVNPKDAGTLEWGDLSDKSKRFVTEFENKTGVPVRYVSTGPGRRFVIKKQ